MSPPIIHWWTFIRRVRLWRWHCVMMLAT